MQRQARETQRAQALVNKAFEGAQEGVLVCDRSGRILLSNPAARTIFRYDEGGLEGRLLEETVVPEHRLRHYRRGMRAILAAREAGEGAGLGPVRFKGRRADGAVIDTLVALRVEETTEGEPRVFVFVRDISARLAVEEKLRLALREARKHAEARSRFLSTMSHEMRTPLHGVVASLDLLAADRLDDEARDLLATARKCSERALDQIDYALDAIRSEDGPQAPTEIDPVAVVRSILEEMGPLAQGKQTALGMDSLGFDGRPRLLGNPKAYARTVFNLVGNAVKFTDGGRVRVRLDLRRGVAPGQAELVTAVSDTGPGIAPEDRDRIFAPFEQAEATALTAANPGFGLGLAIVRQDLARMAGRIEVESTPGAGATFRFVVPLVVGDGAADRPEDDGRAGPRPQPAVAPPARSAGSMAALVVDDNDVNACLVSRMLERLGYAVQCRHSGEDAVALARSEGFGLILMDLRMPGMNGFAATRLIRAGGASREALIVGITAQVDVIETEDFRASGMSSVLTKPFGLRELEAHLAARDAAPGAATDAPDDLVETLSEAFDLTGQEVGLALAASIVAGARDAVAQGTSGADSTAEAAHAAAGAALMMGLSDLGQALQALERAATDGPAGVSPELLGRISVLADRVEAALSRLTAA
nr:ATP-binding protein [Roseibacterium persicicum]